MNYKEVFRLAHGVKDEKNDVYASMWDEFTIFTLLDLPLAKSRRSRTHYERGDIESAIEEALDAINYLNKAVQKLTALRPKEEASDE